MRDIKAIRGDMFAYGVPFELLEEYTDAILSNERGVEETCLDCIHVNEGCEDDPEQECKGFSPIQFDLGGKER
jgi:hypothetical protein